MKKVLSLFLSALLILSTVSCLSVISFGADTTTIPEIEENDETGTAQEILTNETYTGNMFYNRDIDWYKFEADKDYFTLDFNVHDAASAGVLARGWTIKIYDSQLTEIYKYENKTTLSTPNIPINGTIYVSVQAHNTGYDTLNNIDYDLTATTIENSYWENEYNNEVENANLITTNETYSGNMFYNEDIDWYKFEPDKDYFTLDFSPKEVAHGSLERGWNITIYDNQMTEIYKYSNKTTLSTPNIPIKGTIYVCVQAHHTGYNTVNDVYYDLRINTNEDLYWEKEYNNEVENANLITTNETYSGNMFYNEDIDWYKFESDKDYFTLDFSPKGVAHGSLERGWNITIFDSSMVAIYTYSNTTALSTPNIPINGTIYVSVQAHHTGYDTVNDVYYDLRINTNEDLYWEKEYNNDSKNANLITTNETYSGNMFYNSDKDWYKFESDKDYFTLDFGPKDIAAAGVLDRGWKITIYDSSITEIYKFDNYKILTTPIIPFTGTIYVCVEAHHTGHDTVNDVYYTLKANTVTNSNWENEYNDTSTKANTIKQGSDAKGTIRNASDMDFYKFKATSDAFKIRFSIDLNEVSVDKIKNGWTVSVYPADSSASIVSEFTVNSIGSFETRTLPYEKGKEYFIKVKSRSPSEDYSPLNVIYNIAAVDASEGNKWEVENGETDFSSATTVKSGTTIYGNLYTGADKDYYKIKIPASGKLQIKFNREASEAAGAGWYFSLVDAVGSVLETFDLGNSLNATWTSKTISKEGYYFIKMECKNGSNAPNPLIDYNLTFKYTMTAPKLSSVSNGSSGIALKWSKVEDCSAYYVYRKAGSGSWKKLATVKGDTKVTYTDKSVKSGTKYSYKVIAVDGSVKSAYSSAKTITFLTAPKAKTIATSKSGVTFTWTKVSGASGYEVYRATGSGSYKKLVTVKSASTVKFVDKTAKKGTTYKYKVRAYNGSSTSAFSSVKSIKDKY